MAGFLLYLHLFSEFKLMSLEVPLVSPAHICKLKQLTCHQFQLVAALVR